MRAIIDISMIVEDLKKNIDDFLFKNLFNTFVVINHFNYNVKNNYSITNNFFIFY